MSASLPRGSLKLLGEAEELSATGRPVADLSVAEVLTRVWAAVEETGGARAARMARRLHRRPLAVAVRQPALLSVPPQP